MQWLFEMKNECLRNAPQDRRILALNKTWAYKYSHWEEHTGHRWEEIWYNPKPTMSADNWAIWCGNTRTSTTEQVDAVAWAEIPLEINT